MKIEVFGTGCPKCRMVEANVKKALETTSLIADVVKVTDIDEMVERGLMSTPGLAIDGELVSAGRIPSVDEVIQLIRKKS
jgi:small redox-active disulfide protein 2